MRWHPLLLALSLVAGAVFAIFWIGTFVATWEIERHYQSQDGTLHHYTLIIDDSSLIFRYGRMPIANPVGIHQPYWKYERHGAIRGYIKGYNSTVWGRLGFFVLYSSGAFGANYAVSLPCWVFCLLAFGYAAFYWRFAPIRRRRLRMSRGLCAVCGYDLRASQERCPECGSAVATGKRNSRGTHVDRSHMHT